ncbi:cell wall-binding repeat-containing protein [Bacillus sp. SCS-153A]|uniref:cell wall-binding repeat-containing protein n=1 Tax=Rossellomorea sedimentorum TaxID=3115294 RepID=UPI0039058694
MNKKMKKPFMGFAAAALAASITFPVSAEEYKNKSHSEINRLLTEAAIKYEVPPEVVKAIAEEESGWRQFKDGKPFISSDNGIGIMQVTDTDGYDLERLKTDIEYNIKAGIEILNKKWNRGESGITNWQSTSIPTIGDNERDIIENWYFAILAYNGTKQVNSPVKQSDGSINENSYQYKVFGEMMDGNPGIFPDHSMDITFSKEDFTYTVEHDLIFNKKHYVVNGLPHSSKHLFQPGDLVISPEATRFRAGPTSSSAETSQKLAAGKTEVLEILSSFEYDQSGNTSNHFVWYNTEREDNDRTGYVTSSELNKIGQRLSGVDRFDTAVRISKEGWEKADTVVLAQGYNFPDALTGGPLAYKYDAPLLLTDKNKLTASTKKEIERLGADKVIILGGKGAIGTEVETAIRNLGLEVDRIGGQDRFATAQLIAERVSSTPEKAIIAYGYNYPDALSAAPFAASNQYPILLTKTDEVPEATKKALMNIPETIIVGGEKAVSSKVLKEVNGKQRVRGFDRYETSVEIAKQLPLSNMDRQVFMANGTDFPDALAGSVLAAKQGVPLILTETQNLRVNVQAFIEDERFREFNLLGGHKAVNVEDELGEIFKKLYY